ncbi:MAG: nitrilase-related carbon-nitrogen hydrolase [Promethearchaeota archaeon]
MIESLKIKIGLIQLRVRENYQSNLENITQMVKKASLQGAKIICLPELFALPYFAQSENHENFNLAESIPGPLTEFLQNLAKENQITIIGGSIFEKTTNDKYYNTSLIIDSFGKIRGKYRKIHIPNDPFYYEQFYFKPGDLGYVSTKTSDLQIASLICYDQWFPEPARILALKGTKMIFYPTAIGWFPQLKQDEPFSANRWEQAMCSHASLNGIFIAGINRVGKDDNITFWGSSFIADPFGQIIAKGSSTKEEVIIGEINTESIFDSQEGWGFLHNRRPDTYEDLI